MSVYAKMQNEGAGRGEVKGENGMKRMEKIWRRMERLASARVNDAVKLAFLSGERTDEIDSLDLSALAEFRRSGNGGVEIKLTDRMALLEKLAELMDEKSDGAEEFLRAMEGDAP